MCKTFSLPEIKQSDIFGASKASLSAGENLALLNDTGDLCWSDEEFLDLLQDFPDELAMDSDAITSSEDDSSIGYSSISEDSLCATASSTPLQQTFDMGANFGLRSLQEGFVALPNPKAFAQIMFKTPEMIREEKLNIINPFIDAMNEGDLFSLFTICQGNCSSDVTVYSQSCGFKYTGLTPIITFWTLLFQKHYQGRIQCLERRISSTINMPKGQPASGAFDSVNLVLKLEGCRLSPFHNFEIFQCLMNSGYVHDNLSLHELIHLVDGFNMQHQASVLAAYPQQSHYLYHVTYLFEVNLRFHAIHHTISSWNWELLGVESH